jgi:hypothetical protein
MNTSSTSGQDPDRMQRLYFQKKFLSGVSSSRYHIGDKFRMGGGLGFDSYLDWQTMPVFASLS